MTKVKLITTMAGPDGVHSSGAVVEFEDVQADDLVKGGYATFVGPTPQFVAEVVVVDKAEPEPEVVVTTKRNRGGR